ERTVWERVGLFERCPSARASAHREAGLHLRPGDFAGRLHAATVRRVEAMQQASYLARAVRASAHAPVIHQLLVVVGVPLWLVACATGNGVVADDDPLQEAKGGAGGGGAGGGGGMGGTSESAGGSSTQASTGATLTTVGVSSASSSSG